VTRSLRLLAGTLVLALPLAAAAGCGAEKKKTVRQEFSSATDHLADSKAASFTLRIADAQGNLAKLMTKDGDTPPALAQALLKGSITYVTDPAGDATLKSVQAQGLNPADLTSALSKVNSAFVIRDDKGDLVELRVLAGELYAHVNLKEISALAKTAGAGDVDATLDELASSSPQLGKAIADVRAGKWLKLPLAKYLDQLQAMAGSITGATPDPAKKYDFSQLGSKAYAAVKPYVKVTDANDDSKDRVLDVRVQVKPALKAVLQVLRAEKDLPFAGILGSADTEIDKSVKDGIAKGTITLHESHLTGFSVDLESVRQLATDPGSDSLAGVRLTVGVDDSADELSAPTDVSTVDLDKALEELMAGFFGAAPTASG
jgi:hypothetical protein